MSSYLLSDLERKVVELRTENARLHQHIEAQQQAIAIQNDAYGRQGQKLEAAQADARAAREAVVCLTEQVNELTERHEREAEGRREAERDFTDAQREIAELRKRNEHQAHALADRLREIDVLYGVFDRLSLDTPRRRAVP